MNGKKINKIVSKAIETVITYDSEETIVVENTVFKIKIVENDLKFLSVALEEGDNTVVFEYSSPYIKQMGVGCIVAIVGLVAVWFVVKKTKIMQATSAVIAWAGVLLTVAVVAFFMLYPTCVFLVKVFKFFFT